jgi:hypothetical protein
MRKRDPGSRRRQVVGLAAAAVSLLAPATARADPVEPILRLAAEQRYDDDLLNTSGANPPGAFLTKVMPQLGLRLNQPTVKFDGFYGADLLIHDSRGTDVILDHRAALELHADTSRTSHIDGLARFWDTSDPLSLPRQGLARTLARTLYGRADLGWREKIAPRWILHLGYRFEGAKVEEPAHPAGFLNSPAVELAYRLSRRADLGAEYRFQLFKFGPDNATAHSPALVYRYRLSRTMNFKASGGAAFYREPAHPEKNGVVPRFELSVSQRVTRRLDWIVTAGHDLVGASGFSTAVWADYASGTGSYQLLEKLRIFAVGSFYRNGTVPNVGVFPLGWNHDGVAAGYGLGGGVEWRFNRYVAAQATYDRIDQVGGVDIAQTPITRNVVAVRLIVDAF